MKVIRNAIFLMVLMLSASAGLAQKCKYSSKSIRKANKHFTEEKIIQGTKLKPMFSKFSQAASGYFVKSEENYYLALILVRELGRRIDILKDNPMVIQLANDEILTLYPDRDLPGKFTLPVTTEINRPFYKVSSEELELLASNPIAHVKIYFSSDKVSEEKLGRDDLGTFFDYEILSERLQANLQEPAQCISK
ncbi:MAG: hypothetical protein AAF361_10635 [Bacteroidota bacterium]